MQVDSKEDKVLHQEDRILGDKELHYLGDRESHYLEDKVLHYWEGKVCSCLEEVEDRQVDCCQEYMVVDDRLMWSH